MKTKTPWQERTVDQAPGMRLPPSGSGRASLAASIALVLASGPTLAADAAEAGDDAPRERFLYVVATNGDDEARPDMLAIVGADPEKPDRYGEILATRMLPEAGDNVHHWGYSLDQQRLLIPGLFSDRFYVFDIAEDPLKPERIHQEDGLREESGYIAPHTVSPLTGGVALVSMLGADTSSTGPGGLVLIDDETAEFVRHFGPGPDRAPNQGGPEYMYDIALKEGLNRMVTTTWGYPGDVLQPPYSPNGDTVSVWDVEKEEVIQVVNLGEDTGATEADWFHAPDSRYGYTVGTSGGAWLWEDEDGNGRLDFHRVLSDLALPCDMTLSPDDRYLYIANWFGDNVQQYDIREPYQPELVGEAEVPHPCMMRLSPDGERLYVTNAVLSTLDADPEFGPRNDAYGIYLLEVDTAGGGLSHVTGDGSAWADFSRVQTQDATRPMGPHMMLFDPGIAIEAGHH
ncbi:selenium-binding protein SBP56-related protein [Halomonas sp. LR5S13]|uniref:selenium-binding protein SBP56-related protein n=1 Tax=Halomonas rhizosphaerae TaxID=3043296 RepID=UPI0024A8412E|nr:selenium-binding protein SBP56-related protein [Halomonas rhizosphaerae]MDI5921325.1 selenium-binding protein SBP56-related protein [Halomonas rhizosphaerae]